MRKVYSLLRKCVKWRVVPLIFMAVQSNAFAAAQDSSNVSLNFTNQPIENVFIALEKQTGYTVFFSGSTLDGNSRVSVNVSQVSLSNALAAVLRGRNITWTIKHKGIVLSKKPAAPETPASQPVNAAVADTVPLIDVAGVVVDVKGNPIPAATVSIKGYPRGQGTDNLGRFSFTKVPGNATLVFSSLGYDPKQIKIAGRNEIRVALDSAIRDIQGVEVFSTGYQDIPKERTTGSFVQLNNALLNRSVSTNVLDRIYNVTSSLKREQSASSDISIRGFSTINANMKPLIVIDGFAYEEGTDEGQVILNNLNPNDVESITILRDAASASIWGARSGNGVIVIKTKKGSYNKKTRLQFNTSLNFIEKPNINALNIISSKDMIDFERKNFDAGLFNDYDDIYPTFNYYPIVPSAVEILLARRQGKISVTEANTQLNLLANHDSRTDINKYLLQHGFNQQYNLNISGGSNKNSFYASVGYDNNLAPNVGNESNRFTLRLDNTYKPIYQIEINTYISYVQDRSLTNGIDYTQFLGNGGRVASPYTRLADERGTHLHVPVSNTYRAAYIDTISSSGLLDWHYKPLDELRTANTTTKNYATRMGGGLRYSFIPGLSIEGRGQYEKRIGNFINENSVETYSTRNQINSFAYQDAGGRWIYPVPIGTIRNFANRDHTNWNFRIQLIADKSWGQHQINGVLGYEASEALFSSQSGKNYGYDQTTLKTQPFIDYNTVFDKRPSGNNGSARISSNDDLSGTISRFQNYYGNVGYSFRNKYTMTISGRIDKSNFMGAKQNQRMVPLYSTGFGWIISEEEFYNISGIQYVRLRATYGYNGNLNNKATALPIAVYSAANTTPYHNQPFLALSNPPNPGLTWEKIGTTNIGIDFRAANSRIEGSFEFYLKKGTNLIGQVITDPTVGASSYTGNYANMKGKGFDLTLSTINIRRSFDWRTSLNLSYNRDEITHYEQNEVPVNILVNSTMIPIIGKPLYKLYSYSFAGLDPKNGDPMGSLGGEVVDYNRVISEATIDDLNYYGPSTPTIFGTLINSFSYRSISLSFSIIYKLKYYFMRNTISYSTLYDYWGGHSDYALRWKKPGDELTTTVPSEPQFIDSQRDAFYTSSSANVEKGDHIRLQDIRLSYNLSKTKHTWMPFEQMSVFAYANNLGIIWKANKHNIDPDAIGNVPASKSIALGANINF